MSYGIEYVNNFSGGINIQAAPDNMIDGELSVCENADLMTRGGFSKRPGVLPTDFQFNHNTDTHKLELFDIIVYNDILLCVCRHDTSIQLRKIVNYNILPVVTILYTYPASTNIYVALEPKITWEAYKDKLYILGNDQYLVYDYETGTIADVTCSETDSNLAVIKTCLYIKQRGERLFCAKGNSLYFSERGRPEYWKPLSIINAITDNNESITALYEYQNALLIFKPNAIFAWEGYDPTTEVTFKKLNTSTGTKYWRTIQAVEDRLFFLGNSGIYVMQTVDDTRVVTVKVSYNINDAITKDIEYLGMHVLNDLQAKPCAIFFNDKYMLSLHDTVYIYNYDIVVTNKEFNEVWSTYKFNEEMSIIHPSSWSNFCPRSFFVLDKTLMFTYSYNMYMFLKSQDSVSTNYKDIADTDEELIVPKPIKLVVKLRPLTQNDHIRNKKYKTIFTAFRQYDDKHSTCTLTANIDYTDTSITVSPDESLIYDDTYGSSWDTSVWDFSELITRRFPIKKRGKRIIITLTDETLEKTITLYGLGIEYKIKKPDRG